MKLTIEQVAILAANNVKLIILDDDRRQFNDKIKEINFSHNQVETNEGCLYELDDFGIDVFFVLHNLSDLTKEIEIGGKKFIPLLELAKIANVDTADENYKLHNDNENFGIRFNIENDDDNWKYEVFAYDPYNNFGRHKRTEDQNKENSEIYHCPNQLKLYQKLHEWHFDLYGLIENNLAIDINTL